jgi:hypothetical protein
MKLCQKAGYDTITEQAEFKDLRGNGINNLKNEELYNLFLDFLILNEGQEIYGKDVNEFIGLVNKLAATTLFYKCK